MPGFLLHQGAQVACTHQGQAMPTAFSARVSLSGQPATSLAHSYIVAGCPFTTESPKPCATVQWTTPAVRVFVEGSPALLSTSSGVTIGPLGVQGTPIVMSTQTRVSGQ
jgi:hypothetical protein